MRSALLSFPYDFSNDLERVLVGFSRARERNEENVKRGKKVVTSAGRTKYFIELAESWSYYCVIVLHRLTKRV
jgi:hypothetical protein